MGAMICNAHDLEKRLVYPTKLYAWQLEGYIILMSYVLVNQNLVLVQNPFEYIIS